MVPKIYWSETWSSIFIHHPVSSSNHHRLLQFSAKKPVDCEDFHLKGLCRSSLLPWQPLMSTTLYKSCQSQHPDVTAWLILPSSSDSKFLIWILLRCFDSTLNGRKISKVGLTGIGQITNRIFTGSSQRRESLGYKPHRVPTENADSTSPGWRPATHGPAAGSGIIKQLCCRFAAEPWCVCAQVCVGVRCENKWIKHERKCDKSAGLDRYSGKDRQRFISQAEREDGQNIWLESFC